MKQRRKATDVPDQSQQVPESIAKVRKKGVSLNLF
jgi:hypothetical protein